MPDEWICQECGHSTSLDPGDDSCPCGGKMTNIGDADDFKDAKYDEDEDGALLESADDDEPPIGRLQQAEEEF